MPKDSQGQTGPVDAIGRAIMVAKIATGEIEDTGADPSKAHHSAGSHLSLFGQAVPAFHLF